MSRNARQSFSARHRASMGPLVALTFIVGAIAACSSDTGAPPPDSKVPTDVNAADLVGPLDQTTPDIAADIGPDAQVCSVIGKWQDPVMASRSRSNSRPTARATTPCLPSPPTAVVEPGASPTMS